MAAQATICAAVIQGTSALFAGSFVIWGGWLAYKGAIKAAARQAQLEENKHQNRVAAYRNRLSGIVEHLDRCSYQAYAFAKMSLQQFRQHGGVVDPGASRCSWCLTCRRIGGKTMHYSAGRSATRSPRFSRRLSDIGCFRRKSQREIYRQVTCHVPDQSKPFGPRTGESIT